ncbi:MAG TPA: tetratricopeptide repeat protein [Xanthobacteraceae bacterium]|nr:tetratricopeptide repeat protein [Xanthobacteraceae bacterium]
MNKAQRIAETVRFGLAAHRQGKLADAERFYHAALELKREDFDSLHLLGLVRWQQGRHEEALSLITRALGVKPGSAEARANLGLVLQSLNRHAEAVAAYDRALAVNPAYVTALFGRGNALLALGRHAEALANYDKALAATPNQIEALVNRGVALGALGRHAEALASFERALSLQPDQPQLLYNRANSLQALGRHEEAVAAYDRVLAIAPDNPEVLNNRGLSLNALGRYEEASSGLDRALAAQPDSAAAWVNAGNAQRGLDRREAALACYERALACDRDNIEAEYGRGNALMLLNRYREAIDCFGRVLAVRPDHADAHLNRSQALLTLGELARGFEEYEWRWKTSEQRQTRAFDQPLWLGAEPAEGRTILVHHEQGLGDMLQFVRYVPMLSRAGARVVLEVQPQLKDLLSALDGVCAVVDRSAPLPAFDSHCPVGSLPHAFRTELATIPADVPYLRAEPRRVARWKERLDRDDFTIGIAWQGSPTFRYDAGRSIALAQFAPLATAANVRLISLQKGAGCEQIAAVSFAHRIERLTDDQDMSAEGLLDTAAIMANLDLVVTSDSMLAHLAGAMGRPVFVALRQRMADWRWLLDREESPWYPTMRLFRQSTEGDWRDVFERIAAAVKALAARTRP